MKWFVGVLIVVVLIGCAIGAMFLMSSTVHHTQVMTRDFAGGKITIKGDPISFAATGDHPFSFVSPSRTVEAEEDKSDPDWYPDHYAIASTAITAGAWHVEADGIEVTIHIDSPNPMDITYKPISLGFRIFGMIVLIVVAVVVLLFGVGYILDEM